MKIVWTKLALRDVENVRSYIAADNPTAAGQVLRLIESTVENLLSYPNLGRLGRVKGTRELIVIGTPFVIPYRVTKENIEILSVLHGARRWPGSF